MTNIDWAQLGKDRKAGTPGPWDDDRHEHDQPYLPVCIGTKFHAVCTVSIDDSPERDFNSKQYANSRRIARLPEVEAYALTARKRLEAAERLAEAAQATINDDCDVSLVDALATYKAAKRGEE